MHVVSGASVNPAERAIDCAELMQKRASPRPGLGPRAPGFAARAPAAPIGSVDGILGLQRCAGNRAVGKLLRQGHDPDPRQGHDPDPPVELPPVPDVHLREPTLAEPVGAAQPPGGSGLYSGTTINPQGLWTTSFMLGGLGSRSPMLVGPPSGGTSLAVSPLPWMQLTASGSNTGAGGQVQISPSDTRRENISLLGYVTMAPGQQPNSSAWTPTAGLTGSAEAIIGGRNPSSPDWVAGVNVGVFYTPYTLTLLSDVFGVSVAAGLSRNFDPYRDAPAADPADHHHVAPSTTPRWTLGLAAQILHEIGNEGQILQLGADGYVTWTSQVLNTSRGERRRLFITLTGGGRMIDADLLSGSQHGWGIDAWLTFGLIDLDQPRAPAGGHQP
jgi:hypothetical protein